MQKTRSQLAAVGGNSLWRYCAICWRSGYTAVGGRDRRYSICLLRRLIVASISDPSPAAFTGLYHTLHSVQCVISCRQAERRQHARERSRFSNYCERPANGGSCEHKRSVTHSDCQSVGTDGKCG